MKETIRMRWLTSAATDTRAYEKGDECEWDKADAYRENGLIATGKAEAVTAKTPETPKGK